MKWQDVVPVIISISVIIIVSLLQRYSKLFAAVTATMPLTIPLALWIVYTAAQGERAQIEEFTRSLVIGVIPTLAFTLALWIGARAELKLIPMLVVGYVVWGVVLFALIAIQRLTGM